MHTKIVGAGRMVDVDCCLAPRTGSPGGGWTTTKTTKKGAEDDEENHAAGPRVLTLRNAGSPLRVPCSRATPPRAARSHPVKRRVGLHDLRLRCW